MEVCPCLWSLWLIIGVVVVAIVVSRRRGLLNGGLVLSPQWVLTRASSFLLLRKAQREQRADLSLPILVPEIDMNK